ncbi:uncharacterized protein LOC129972373 [Argiope bruennichi]|uniref:uncharacterized protein LOC129972373 n=1 Tax=Argiope bruennichi TaxID=94029 RepID=UPI0024943E65|nr:uncharacterized protein LOC129972373 [Argiope bruennichi]
MLAHGAGVWCLHPTVRLATKLSFIQRGYLLAITEAYNTTPLQPLQVILGLPPLHLQLQMMARRTKLYRLRGIVHDMPHISPYEYEHRATGWTSNPSKHLQSHQISLEDGGSQNVVLGICTDGSKSSAGIGAAFYVMQEAVTIDQWSTSLFKENTAFQAELLAINRTAKYTTSLPTSDLITIYVDNKIIIKHILVSLD